MLDRQRSEEEKEDERWQNISVGQADISLKHRSRILVAPFSETEIIVLGGQHGYILNTSGTSESTITATEIVVFENEF